MKDPAVADISTACSCEADDAKAIKKLKKLLDQSLDVICSIDAEGRFVSVSAASRAVWGYDPTELIGKLYIDYVAEKDRERTLASAREIMLGINRFDFENSYITKSGEARPIVWSAHWDDEEQLMFCVARDASERKKVEKINAIAKEKAEQDAQKLQAIFESLGDGLFTMDRQWRVTYLNSKVEQLTGFVKEKMLGKCLWEIYPEAINSVAYREYHWAMEHNQPVRFEIFSQIFKRWYSVNAYPYEDGIAIYYNDISLQKKLTTDLQQSQQQNLVNAGKIASILDSIQDGFFAVDRNWTVTYWNKKAEELLLKRREDILGKNLWEEYKEAVTLEFFPQYHKAVDDNVPVHFEEFFEPVDMWLEVRAYPTGDGLSVFFSDITLRKKQEITVQLINDRYAFVSQATSDAIWDWDLEKEVIYRSSAFTLLFGYEAAIPFEAWAKNVHEQDRGRVLKSLQEALEDRNASGLQHQYRFVKKDGSIAYVNDRSILIRNSSGNVIRMVGAMQDITKLKLAEEELERLSIVARETVNAVVITDPSERITWVNKAFTEISGYEFEEAIGRKPGELLQGPATDPATRQYLKDRIQNREPFSCEIINYAKDGRPYWMEIKGQPILNANGEVQHFFAIQTDITAKKESEAALRASEEKYRLLFYQSMRPKWMFDAVTYEITAVNDAAVKLYGYSRKEFLSMKAFELRHEQERSDFYKAMEMLREKKQKAFNKCVRHVKKSGEEFFVSVDCHVVDLPGNMYLINTIDDMTEKLELQRMIIDEKVESQKEIARAIIRTQENERTEIGKELHDNVNQVLTTIKLYIENIKVFPEQRDLFVEKGVCLTQKAIDEIRTLAKQLVTPVMADLGFRATIEELISHYQSLNKFNIRLKFTVPEEGIDKLMQVTIYRILQEMLNNTVKYARAANVKVCVLLQAKQVRVCVEDDGVGFDLEKINPGMGLKNISNRAELFRGRLDIKSSPGNGTRLCVRFPFP